MKTEAILAHSWLHRIKEADYASIVVVQNILLRLEGLKVNSKARQMSHNLAVLAR